MKKWQKDRNYKRVKDKDGNVIANIITVFGQDVEVSDEIFDIYSQMDRRARYIGEDIPAESEISLERTIEDGIHIETLENAELSAEEYCLLEEEAEHEAKMLDELPKVIESLPESDKKLIKRCTMTAIRPENMHKNWVLRRLQCLSAEIVF